MSERLKSSKERWYFESPLIRLIRIDNRKLSRKSWQLLPCCFVACRLRMKPFWSFDPIVSEVKTHTVTFKIQGILW